MSMDFLKKQQYLYLIHFLYTIRKPLKNERWFIVAPLESWKKYLNFFTKTYFLEKKTLFKNLKFFFLLAG